jgi:hypothetical protein
MKRNIYLKTEYFDLNDKKFNKTQQQEAILKNCQDSIKEFKDGMKELISNKTVKVIKDYAPESQVLIQFDDDKRDEVVCKLISLSIVDTIDSFLPSGD